jgi:hypothetical protein
MAWRYRLHGSWRMIKEIRGMILHLAPCKPFSFSSIVTKQTRSLSEDCQDHPWNCMKRLALYSTHYWNKRPRKWATISLSCLEQMCRTSANFPRMQKSLLGLRQKTVPPVSNRAGPQSLDFSCGRSIQFRGHASPFRPLHYSLELTVSP